MKASGFQAIIIPGRRVMSCSAVFILDLKGNVNISDLLVETVIMFEYKSMVDKQVDEIYSCSLMLLC